MTELNIQHLSLSRLSREDLEKKFADDDRLEKILLIFDNIDLLDGNKEGQLSEIDLIEMMTTPYGKDSNGFQKHVSLDKSHDGKLTDYELKEYFSKAKEFYGEDILLEDYQKFIEYAAAKGQEHYEAELEKASIATGMSEELIEKLGGPYIANEYTPVMKDNIKYYERTTADFSELRDETGKLLEIREKNSAICDYNGCEQVTTYNEGGIATENFINHQTGEQTMFQYANELDKKNYKIHIKDGVAVKQSTSDGEKPWKNMQLEDIVFGAGTPDSSKVSFKYDSNNKLSEIKISDTKTSNIMPKAVIKDGIAFIDYVQEDTDISTKTFEDIKQMIDGGARYGEDFELKIENGELKIVPKIKNETDEETPELKGEAFDKYRDLISKGIHAEEDFEVIYDKNGNFRYIYKNNQAREFDAEYKTEIYDKEGKLITSLTVKNGKVIREVHTDNGIETIESSFDDAFIQLLMKKDFAIAGEILGKDDILSGGYNIYPMAEKYREIFDKELIGDVYDEIKNNPEKGVKNLMAKLTPQGGYFATKEDAIKSYKEGYEEFNEILSFNPYDSQIADLLPEIKRIVRDKNSYTEQINNDKYDINFKDGEISIMKNGKHLGNLNCAKFPPNYIKNLLLQVPATVLSDMVESKVDIILDDSLEDSFATRGLNGFYKAIGKGQITLDPNALIGSRAIKTIVHESGHMCDHIDDKDNAISAIKEMMKDPNINFGRDKAVTVDELLERWGTLQPVSIQDRSLKETFQKEYAKYLEKQPNVNINAKYALENMAEFFAESYTLLNLGSCKSEYIIANYFPESLARVKEIMEENRTYRN